MKFRKERKKRFINHKIREELEDRMLIYKNMGYG